MDIVEPQYVFFERQKRREGGKDEGEGGKKGVRKGGWEGEEEGSKEGSQSKEPHYSKSILSMQTSIL